MEAGRLAIWLHGKGYAGGGAAPESLCRPELARLWEHLGVPGAQPAGAGEGGAAEAGQWLSAAPRCPRAAQQAEAVKAALQLELLQQASEDAAPMQELALRAFRSRLQTLAAALTVQEQLLQSRSDEAAGLFPPTAAGDAQPVGEQTLDSFEEEVTAEVRRGLASNSLALAKVDWQAVASAARARSRADGGADAAMAGCPAAILPAALARSRRAAAGLHAEGLDAASKATAGEAGKVTAGEAGSAGAGQDAGDLLMYAGHGAEVRLFFQTQQAAEQERASAKTLLSLTETVERLCGGSETGAQRKRLLVLQAENAGTRAAVTALEREMAELRRRDAHLQQVQGTLAEIMESVVDSRMCNLMLDHVLQDLASSGAAFLARWPPNAAAARAAVAADAALHQASLPSLLAAVQAALAADAGTLLQLAPAPPAGRDGGGQPVATVQQRRRLKHQTKLVQAMARGVAAVREAAEEAALAGGGEAALAAARFAQATAEDCEALAGLRAAAAAALTHGTTAVPAVLQAWWEQPAAHAAPWVEYEGKSAREWLTQIQAWHAGRKRASVAGQ